MGSNIDMWKDVSIVKLQYESMFISHIIRDSWNPEWENSMRYCCFIRI